MKKPNAVELILALHKRDKAPTMKQMSGLWERKLDERWTFWINGQLKTLKTPRDVSVHPGDCYVEYNGWPAGSFSLITGEGVIAAGGLANYETFCEALRTALAAHPETPEQSSQNSPTKKKDRT